MTDEPTPSVVGAARALLQAGSPGSLEQYEIIGTIMPMFKNNAGRAKANLPQVVEEWIRLANQEQEKLGRA